MVSGFGSRGFGTRARLDDQPDAAQLYLFIGDGSGTRRPGRKQGHTLFSFLLPSLFPACVFGADRASPFPISIDCAASVVCVAGIPIGLSPHRLHYASVIGYRCTLQQAQGFICRENLRGLKSKPCSVLLQGFICGENLPGRK